MSAASDVEAILRLVRHELASDLDADLVGAVLFEGVARNGGQPPTADGVAEFVRGPLCVALTEQLGSTRAAEIVERVGGAIVSASVADVITGERRGLRRTAEVGRATGPVRVLALGPAEPLVEALRLALGERVLAVGCGELASATKLAGRMGPQVVLLDEAAPPPGEVAEVARVLDALEGSPLVVVWTTGGEYAQALFGALPELTSAQRLVALAREEGVAPLLDLVRSRALT